MTAPVDNYVRAAKVTHVYDGDTIAAIVDLGYVVSIGNDRKPVRYRLANIDAFETTLRAGTTPEEKAKGIAAKAWLTERLLGQDVTIESKKLDGEDAKFWRYLAVVWHNGECINDKMVELGFTKR